MIEIIYPSGYMTISLDKFFPASSDNLKKLIKIIDMDWQHKDQIIQDIVTWINREIKNSEDTAKAYANKYVVIHPQVIEAYSRKKALEISVNQLKGTPAHKLATERMKDVRRDYNRLKGLEISYDRAFKQNSLKAGKLKKNLAMLL